MVVREPGELMDEMMEVISLLMKPVMPPDDLDEAVMLILETAKTASLKAAKVMERLRPLMEKTP
jgi:hypothetical protein